MGEMWAWEMGKSMLSHSFSHSSQEQRSREVQQYPLRKNQRETHDSIEALVRVK